MYKFLSRTLFPVWTEGSYAALGRLAGKARSHGRSDCANCLSPHCAQCWIRTFKAGLKWLTQGRQVEYRIDSWDKQQAGRQLTDPQKHALLQLKTQSHANQIPERALHPIGEKRQSNRRYIDSMVGRVTAKPTHANQPVCTCHSVRRSRKGLPKQAVLCKAKHIQLEKAQAQVVLFVDAWSQGHSQRFGEGLYSNQQIQHNFKSNRLIWIWWHEERFDWVLEGLLGSDLCPERGKGIPAIWLRQLHFAGFDQRFAIPYCAPPLVPL